MELIVIVFIGAVFVFIMRQWYAVWRAGQKHGGGLVGQALAMKEQLEEASQTECAFCGATIPRGPAPCPACGARD